MMIMMGANMYVNRISPATLSRPANVQRVSPYAPRADTVRVRSTVAVDTARLFWKKRRKFVSATRRAKFVAVGCVGTRAGGVAKISPEGLSAVESIHSKGKAPTRKRRAPAA